MQENKSQLFRWQTTRFSKWVIPAGNHNISYCKVDEVQKSTQYKNRRIFFRINHHKISDSVEKSVDCAKVGADCSLVACETQQKIELFTWKWSKLCSYFFRLVSIRTQWIMHVSHTRVQTSVTQILAFNMHNHIDHSGCFLIGLMMNWWCCCCYHYLKFA